MALVAVDGAKISCSAATLALGPPFPVPPGASPTSTVEGTCDVEVTGCSDSILTTSDKEVGKNIIPFAANCRLIQNPFMPLLYLPCQPIINDKWEKTADSFGDTNEPILTENSCINCTRGGLIEIADPNQNHINTDNMSLILEKIKDILNDGNDFDVSEGDLDKIRDELKNISPEERALILSQLSDHELDVLFHNVHSTGFLSNDWNERERNEFYKLITNADDETLERIAASSPLTLEYLKVYQASNLAQPNYDIAWSTADLARWQAGDVQHLWDEKKRFIEGNRDIINALAAENDIPPLLLAGVAFSEFGGDPIWIDDVAGTVRGVVHSGPDRVAEKLASDPNKTSFGNMSIQVRTAAATLGYDPNNLSDQEKDLIVEALKDPVVGIAIAAQHLSDLRDIDYAGVTSSNMTDNQIRDIATRYNRGGGLSLEDIQNNTDYGDDMLSHQYTINNALNGEIQINSVVARTERELTEWVLWNQNPLGKPK